MWSTGDPGAQPRTSGGHQRLVHRAGSHPAQGGRRILRHPLISRRLDPKFPPSTEDTAKLVSRLTDPSLATKQVKIEIDDKLVEIVGDAVIRREAVFPHKRLSSNSVAVLLVNPLDYAPQVVPAVTELTIEEIRFAPAKLSESLRKIVLKTDAKNIKGESDVDSDSVAEVRPW